MKHPNKTMILKALDLVVQAEKLWRGAWDKGPPATPQLMVLGEGLEAAKAGLRSLIQS
jgi:hypothetical protein